MTLLFSLLRAFGWFIAAIVALCLVAGMIVNEFYPGGCKELLKEVERDLEDSLEEHDDAREDEERRRRFFDK